MALSRVHYRIDNLQRWTKSDRTTADVKANCDDLKVLGKGDFKALIKWRLALREEVCRSSHDPLPMFTQTTVGS